MKIFISIIILIFVTSCGKDKPYEPPEIDTFVLMPLAINNNWKYTASYLNSTGAADSTNNLIVFILKDTLIDSTIWFKAPGASSDILYQNRTEGLWIKEGSSSSRLGFLYPVSIDTTYQSGQVFVRINTTTVQITTAGDIFTCLKYTVYEPISNTDSTYYYFAPGFGLIQREIYRFETNRYYLAQRWKLTSLLLY